MTFEELLATVRLEPVFESSILLAGDVDRGDVRRQLSRWVAAGRLHQLRRGLYALAPPWQKAIPHPFVVANALEPGSCVSLQSALAWHGLIPEAVPVTTSVGSGRPLQRETPLGPHWHRHLAPRLMFGFAREDLGCGQAAWIAGPEKALLDLAHLEPGAGTDEWLAELRLQSLETLDLDRLAAHARAFGRPKLLRAAAAITALAACEAPA